MASLKRIRSSEFQTWLVSDRQGLVGVINLSTSPERRGRVRSAKLAQILNGPVFPMSTRTRDWLVLERMGENQLEILPVVSRADVHKLEGIVTLRDVLIPTA